MLEVNRRGFTELGGSEGARDDSQGIKTVNIIFVHGLGGDPLTTWMSSVKADKEPAVGSSGLLKNLRSIFKPSSGLSESDCPDDGTNAAQGQLFWPHEYLAEDIPQARVWTYGYNADVLGSLFQASNKSSVSQHCEDLRVRLERNIDNQDPIIFVAHSLGGIIVKDAIRRSQAGRQRTKFIVFLGTPHRGSEVAGWGEIASNLARLALQDPHKKILETLKPNSEVLDNINDQFLEVAFEQGIHMHSFREGRGMSGMRGLHQKVVSDFSSKLGLPNNIETTEGLDLDHRQMARCKDRSDENYRAILGVLKQFLKRESSNADLPIRSVQLTHQEERPSASQEPGTACATPPYYHLQPRNPRFIGRTGKLKELEEKLIISSDCRKLALVGLGGVGKSQVALQLAYTVKERWPEFSILWVPAVSGETFEQAYKEVASLCSITLDPTKEDLKESVRRYLNSNSAGKFLLIVDNADDEKVLFGEPNGSKAVTDYLPNSENGLTLFTTRHLQMAVWLAGKDMVEVQEMNNEEAETFLGESLKKKEMLQDRAVTAELLTELTRLPLAITQAAAYVNAMQIPLQKYLSLLRDTTEQDTISLLEQEFGDGTRYPNSEHPRNAVAATWLVSFNHIRRSQPDAADLLSFISCIEHKAIPLSMLPKVKLKERMVRAIGTLRAYAFVTQRDNAEIYDMHRLVHLGAKVWLGKQSVTKEWNKKAAVHLVKIFPSYDYSNRAIWRAYLPHAVQILRNTKMLDIDARYNLCLRVGRCLRVDGRIGEAVAWLSECFTWRHNRLPEDHPSRLASQQALAAAYLDSGQVKEAVKHFKQVVTINNKILVENNPSRLASQYALAAAYLENGQVKEAIKLLEHVVGIVSKFFMEDDHYRLLPQHELAVAYAQNGQVKEAVKLLKYVVAIQKVFAEDHPGRLTSKHALAMVYEKNGQVKEAIELLEHVVAIEKVLAEDDPSRLASQHSLAVVYGKIGQVREAVELLEQVVAIQKVLAENHPDQLASQHELAVAYGKNGQVREAIKLLEHVVAIQKVLAEDHPKLLGSQHELAVAYGKNGQVREAIKLLEHVEAIRRKMLAENHPSRLASQHSLAVVYGKIGQVREAVELLEQVVAIQKKVLAEDHPNRLRSERALSDLYAKQRSQDTEEA